MKKLFVSGFPLGITELELATLIAPYGDIDTIKIVRDKKTKKCKGYAFI
ncbi:RNA-binding protein [Mucilaginibacter conchicola]|uniref:RNA-binding protein n=1 Tax=Mucilaginibacter conchicola TaxID=2303333 RepID=A0A372NV04_9SPHI|nr:RNA-binding protein [Mucilaginibacter conchicola]RFZ92864.1 RNA-binding protein [Mucilaginibacter conchicola]